MARTPQEAILIILDVGPSVYKELCSNGLTFFENAKQCATMIIQRKIFSKAKDELGLILLSSEETNNPLADEEGYQNIEIAQSLQLANWNMIHRIADFKTSTSVDGDWLDSLFVALDFMKTATEGKKFSEKKIVLFTNFHSDVCDDNVENFINKVKDLGVQIIVIGPQIHGWKSEDSPDVRIKRDGEQLVSYITNETGGITCSFSDALPQLMYFERKKVRPMPWKAILEVGSDLKIPVAGYKKINDVSRVATLKVMIPEANRAARNLEQAALQSVPTIGNSTSSSNGTIPPFSAEEESLDVDNEQNIERTLIKDEGITRVEQDRVFTTVGDEPVPVDVADLIEGYRFGSTIVPVSEDDKEALIYDSGPKCFSVLGFTSSANIQRCYLVGKGCMYFFPEKEENCMRAFVALIQAMHTQEMVAIVRRVYRAGTGPTVGALFPKIRENYQCLVYLELPFSDEIKTLIFPPLVGEKNKPTQDQVNAVDQLITAMDLMTADQDDEGEPAEAYRPKKCLDPVEQHMYHVLARKAMEKNSYTDVTEVHESVQKMMKPKPELAERAKPVLQRIQDLFPLTEITPKEGARKAAADIFLQPIDSKLIITQGNSSTGAVNSIGTLHPQEDFACLMKQNVPFGKVCEMMQLVIKEMVLKAFDAEDLKKPLDSLKVLRKECVTTKPLIFNEWIAKFRVELPTGKRSFWRLVAGEQLGLITKLESEESSVSLQDAKKFLEDDSVEDIHPLQTNDGDFDDLINQM